MEGNIPYQTVCADEGLKLQTSATHVHQTVRAKNNRNPYSTYSHREKEQIFFKTSLPMFVYITACIEIRLAGGNYWNTFSSSKWLP